MIYPNQILAAENESLRERLKGVKRDAARVRAILLALGDKIPEQERATMVGLLNNITR